MDETPPNGPEFPPAGVRPLTAAARLDDHLFAALQSVLPHHALSRIAHRLTRWSWPPAKNALIRGFVRHYSVDMTSAQQQQMDAYPHFNAFFTRALREDSRPMDSASDALVSPVDGMVTASGPIDQDALFQAKNRQVSLHQLLGGSASATARYHGGVYATFYLSPGDYHRIHMPLSGTLLEMTYIPGRLFGVSPATSRAICGLFSRNERVIVEFRTALGPLALVLVGALLVGSIETVWHGELAPPRGHATRHWRYGSEGEGALRLRRGEELGRFNMGSTVIVLVGSHRVRWSPTLHSGQTVRVRERIGSVGDR